MGETTYIYGLLCPLTDKVRYVGRSEDPIKRFRQHVELRDQQKGKQPSPKQEWIRGLKDRGLEPELVVLEELEGSTTWLYSGPDREGRVRRIHQQERRWIERLAAAGHPLTNRQRIPPEDGEGQKALAQARERGRAIAEALGVKPRELLAKREG